MVRAAYNLNKHTRICEMGYRPCGIYPQASAKAKVTQQRQHQMVFAG